MAVLAPVVVAGSEREGALLALASRSTSGTGGTVEIRGPGRWLVFQLAVTVYSGTPGDGLDVWVQHSWDGVNWEDLVGFLRVEAPLPTGADLQTASVPVRREGAAGERHSAADGSLPAGVRDTVPARRFRVKWTVTGANAYSFAVCAFVRE